MAEMPKSAGPDGSGEAAKDRAGLTPLREEVERRAALVREPQPEGARRPPLRMLLAELFAIARRTVARVGPAPGRAQHPGPVMVIPGFGSHNRRMKPLLASLEAAGHTVEGWGLGLNLGPTPENFEYLMKRVDAFASSQGAQVALVGWSLGGVFAREVARRQPDNVSKVITMGSPFSGDLRANNGWRAYQAITGHSVDAPPIEGFDAAAKPPVPTIALWSPRDGIIHPRSAAGWPGERDRAVALRCTHMGFAYRPEVAAEVLRQLDRQD